MRAFLSAVHCGSYLGDPALRLVLCLRGASDGEQTETSHRSSYVPFIWSSLGSLSTINEVIGGKKS